jgi:PhnB protein
MSIHPIFKMAFSIGSTNEERIEAFELYQKAFNAKKVSEGVPPDGSDIHIMMEINGFEILIGPGNKVKKVLENSMTCEIHFDNESDLRKAYNVLAQGGQNCSIRGPYPWATLLALVIDKFGIAWAFYFNE